MDSGDERFSTLPSWADKLAIIPLLATVVVSSIGMVRTATVLGTAFGISDAVLGILVLATLTGIPNAVAAVRLAVQGRGSAVVSEASNSNTLNLLAGVYLPTLAMILFLRRDALTRWDGGLLILGYAVFAWLVASG